MISQIILTALLVYDIGNIANVFTMKENNENNLTSFIVKLKEKTDKNEILNKYSSSIFVDSIDFLNSPKESINTFLIDTSNSLGLETFLESDGSILSFTIDEKIQLFDYSKEKILDNTDVSLEAEAIDEWAENISLSKAWQINDSASNIRVALLDSGVDGDHSELSGSLNKILSKSFAKGCDALEDKYGHGTKVAGIITAKHDGDLVYGISDRVDLVSIRMTDDEAYSSYSDIASAINYAETINSDLINFSYLFPEKAATYLEEAIDNFSGIFVCAGGNEGDNLEIITKIPACLDSDNIVVVGATNSSDDIQTGLNTGPSVIDLFAPGGNMYLLNNTGGYYKSSYSAFTSYATPVVTGALALYMQNHQSASNRSIINRLLSTVDKGTQFNNKCVSNGRINIFKLLHENHNYQYRWLNNKQHEVTCSECDYKINAGHVVESGAFEGGSKLATCLLCGGSAEMGFVIGPMSTYNNNTSQIINGILVLSDTDYLRFIKGELSDEEILSYFN